MKKAIIFALVFVLALSLLTACGSNDNGGGSSTTPPADNSTPAQTDNGNSQTAEQSADDDTSTPSDESKGLDESDYKWEENEFTKLVTKPDFGLLFMFESFDGNPLSAQIHNCTDEQIEAYMESVRTEWSDGEIVTDADGRLAIKRSDFGVEVVKLGGTLTIFITKMQ